MFHGNIFFTDGNIHIQRNCKLHHYPFPCIGMNIIHLTQRKKSTVLQFISMWIILQHLHPWGKTIYKVIFSIKQNWIRLQDTNRVKLIRNLYRILRTIPHFRWYFQFRRIFHRDPPFYTKTPIFRECNLEICISSHIQ